MSQKTNKPLYKKIWFWIVIILIMRVASNIINKNKTTDTSTKNTPKVQTKKHKVETKKHEVEKEKKKEEFDFSNSEITEENIKKALGSDFKSCKVTISEEKGKKIIDVIKPPADYWSGESLAKGCCKITLDVIEKLFVNSKIDIVHYWIKSKFQDEYGNEKVENAMQLGFSRETYKKMNIKNLKETAVLNYKNIINIADSEYIHPAIQKELN